MATEFYCTSCGRRAGVGVRFCTSCGAALTAPADASGSPQTDATFEAPTVSRDDVTFTSQPLTATPGRTPPPVAPRLVPPARVPPDRDRNDRGGRRSVLIVLGIALGGVALLGLGVVLALVLTRPGPRAEGAASSTSGSPRNPATTSASRASSPSAADSPTTPASPTPTARTAQQTAQEIDGLLGSSVSGRSALGPALADVAQCAGASHLAGDATAISGVVANRQALVTQLAAIDVSALPGGAALKSGLAQAWQLSLNADRAYLGWVSDAEAGNCQGSSNKAAGDSYSVQATAGKQAFLASWNPVAAAYGLPSRQPGDI